MKQRKIDLLILSQNLNLPTHNRILHEAKKLKLKTNFLSTTQSFLYVNKKANQDNKKYTPSVVLHRTMGVNFDEFDLRQSCFYEKNGARISNPLRLLLKCRDKLAQLQELESLNVPIVPTFALRGNIADKNKVNLDLFIQEIESPRFILKTERGNQGKGVNLIQDASSLYSWLDTFYEMGDQRFMIQPYIEGAIEYRVLMIGRKIIGMIKKEKQEGFKANAASAKFIYCAKIAKKMQSIASLIQSNFSSDFLAIDFLQTNEKIYVLEIGLCPGFIEFEKASQINIAKTLLEHLFK